MKPIFADAVDPIFLHVLRTLDRIGENDPPEPVEERELLRNWFRDTEARLGQRPEWELAKYALAAWIDDVLTDAPWPGRQWWENNSLEFEFFKTHDRATLFYTKAQEAATLSGRDALEVFYLCVILGFRGFYRDAQAAFVADQLELPPDLETWTRQTAKSIRLGQGRPHIEMAVRPGEGAPPLEGKFRLVGLSLLGAIMGGVVAMACWFMWSVGSG